MGNTDNIRMTKKQRYEYLIKQLTEKKEALRTANTEADAKTALTNLSGLIKNLKNDVQLTDVENIIADISLVISLVRLYDSTRNAVDELLQHLINEAETIVKEEISKEGLPN